MVSQFTANIEDIENMLVELDLSKAMSENTLVLDDVEFLAQYYYCYGYLKAIVQKARNDKKAIIILSIETANVIASLNALQKENDVFK